MITKAWEIMKSLMEWSERTLEKMWVRVFALIFAVTGGINSVSNHFNPPDPSKKTSLGIMILVVAFCLLVAMETLRVWVKIHKREEPKKSLIEMPSSWLRQKKSNFKKLLAPKRKLSEAEKKMVSDVKAARKNYAKAASENALRVDAITKELNYLNDPRGKLVGAGGGVPGVKVYERWIDTPQGSGSIVGVKATAEDNTSINKRLSATRIVALGIFALAAPKKSGSGHAYVVIEGPHVNGVATFAGTKSESAGPAAFSFAALVNNAARNALVIESTRPEQVIQKEAELSELKKNQALANALANLDQKIALLPSDLVGRYGKR
ncbi:MAG: hypothetical protein WCH77_12015 [Planctomycetota bacterium]